MPQIINFDVLTCDTVEVQKTVAGMPRVWHLRDDVSAETMIRFFELARAEEAVQATAENATAGVVASFRAADRIYLSVLLDIFRHTYPETDEAELRAAFSYEERKRLVDLFFSLAGIGLSGPSSAPPSSMPTLATATTNTNTTPNRATRRAGGRKGKVTAGTVSS